MARSRLIEKAFLEHWLHRLVTPRYSFQLAGLYHSSDRGVRDKKVDSALQKETASSAGETVINAWFRGPGN